MNESETTTERAPTSDPAAIVAAIDELDNDGCMYMRGGITLREREILAHWPAIRAALERQAEVERALEEYGQHLPACSKYVHTREGRTLWDSSQDCTCGWEEVKALLAQLAEEKGFRTAELKEAAHRVAAINTSGNALPTWASEPIEDLRRVLYGDKPFMPRES